MSARRLVAVMVKELRQLRRDRMTLAMIVGIPVLQLLLFGYAINLDVRGLRMAVADEAHTAQSRAYAQDLVENCSPVAIAWRTGWPTSLASHRFACSTPS